MKLDHLQKIWLLPFCIVMAVMTYNLVLNRLPPPQEIQDLVLSDAPKGMPATKESIGDNTKATASPSAITQGTSFTPNETKEIREWMDDKGYLSVEDENTYKYYSDDVLESLAKNNDWRAIMYLANKLVSMPSKGLDQFGRDVKYEKAKAYWWKAAILGSTLALDNIATVMNVGLDDPANRPVALNILAIYKTMEIRGDLELGVSSRKSFIEMRNITLTPEEQEIVNAKANALYDKLNAERMSMGYKSFDNGMSDSVKRFLGINR